MGRNDSTSSQRHQRLTGRTETYATRKLTQIARVEPSTTTMAVLDRLRWNSDDENSWR